MLSFYLSLILFCFSTSISPGPANILAMMSGAQFGMVKSLPVFFGILIGFNLMIFLVGMGLGEVFHAWPLLQMMIKYGGILYMLYLAYCMMKSSAPIDTNTQSVASISFMKAALLQWVNPKAWVMAIGAVSAYALPDARPLIQSGLIALTFFVIGIPCIGVWLVSGVLIRQWLDSEVHRRIFNVTTGILLLISILFILIES